MKRIQHFLAAIALLAALGGLPFLGGMGSISLANAASIRHASSVSAPSVAGKSLAFNIHPPCGAATDC